MTKLQSIFGTANGRVTAPLGGLLLTAFLALAAHAALPALSDSERLAQSELVVTGHVDTVSDQGLEELKRPSDGKVLAVLHCYRAKLTVSATDKGSAKPGDVVTVDYHQMVEGPPGPQGQNELLPANADVRVFLKKVQGGTGYEMLQPNGWQSLGAR